MDFEKAELALISHYRARWGRDPQSEVQDHGVIDAYIHEVHYGHDVVVNFAQRDMVDTPEIIQKQLDFTRQYNHYSRKGRLLSINTSFYLILDNGRICDFF